MGKIIFADGDLEYINGCVRKFQGEDCLECCQDGSSVLRLLEETAPEMLVLDLKLLDVDGTWVLRRGARENLLPTTIVTGYYFSSSLVNILAQYGVVAVVHKPYDPMCLLELIHDLRKTEPLPQSSPGDWVCNTLISLGVLTSQKGFRYLRDGILEKARDDTMQMTKCLYPTIAKQYDISTTAVEKAIRTAIHTAYRRRNTNQWRRFFPPDQSGQIPQPTNSYFITRLAESCPKHQP